MLSESKSRCKGRWVDAWWPIHQNLLDRALGVKWKRNFPQHHHGLNVTFILPRILTSRHIRIIFFFFFSLLFFSPAPWFSLRTYEHCCINSSDIWHADERLHLSCRSQDFVTYLSIVNDTSAMNWVNTLNNAKIEDELFTGHCPIRLFKYSN